MGNLRQSLTQEEWNEMGMIPDNIPDKKVVPDNINHPSHYGGKDNPYEAIKVIEAWSLDFCLGNVIKYLSRAGKKNQDTSLEDLMKAAWYLDRAIKNKISNA